MSNDYVFDIETYPNVFTLALEHADAPLRWAFEISDWRNDSKDIIAFLQYLKDTNARMVGFNSLGFDYPVLHTLIRMGHSDANTLYQKAMAIIHSQDDDSRWMHQVNPSDRFVEQIDLFKIHHFDNKARATSLKVLEFNMRSDNIEDLPFKVGTTLTQEQTIKLKQYNAHDVAQTKLFYFKTLDMIRFREELTHKYQRDFMNHNDTKIGKDYFIMKMEESGVACYDFGPKGRTPRQTVRPVIYLKDAILPWVQFQEPEFNRVLNWLKDQSITETKGVFDDVTARVQGFEFVFGLGGIHGSIESEVVESDDEHVIVDLDVSSYYPNLAIANNFHPAHLGKDFCAIYKHLYEQRKTYPKKSAENAMLKLALNGVYGDSNNRFSVFYDPLFTMSITLNGQLLLCLLAEGLMHIEGLRLIQVNTDGLTVRVPRANKWLVDTARAAWQQRTGLELEEAIYKTMMIRDVNNYIAQYENGSVKRKGAYEYSMGWHQNAGGLVIAKVAEKVLTEGAPIRETLYNWPDIMDFMLRTKVPRSSYLAIEYPEQPPQQLQNITRYYIAEGGGRLFKWMPPLKGKQEWRKIGVESGWGVQPCNDIRDAGKLPVDFDYYVREVEKLCLGLA
jgi:Predicted 3'-5' exonuclease related to the exonuclease domain of PolB